MALMAMAQITLSVVIDVKATYRYYLLQSSTLAKPAKPTTFPPENVWDDVEPTYTDGSTNSLYFVDCTVFCDDTFSYSEVSLSSSYEAAKAAYNKAVNAQNNIVVVDTKVNDFRFDYDQFKSEVSRTYATIDSLTGYYTIDETNSLIEQTSDSIRLSVESLTIGAKNLIRNSATLIFDGYGFLADLNAENTTSVN